jgi:hypothetical protein
LTNVYFKTYALLQQHNWLTGGKENDRMEIGLSGELLGEPRWKCGGCDFNHAA